jgi:hypothetical protein
MLLRRDRPALAGTRLALAIVKPQLVHLFWLALLVWLVRGRPCRVLADARLPPRSASPSCSSSRARTS